MMYLCQFGQNLAIGAEDRVQVRLFHTYYLILIKYTGKDDQILINYYNPPNDISVQD